MGIPTVQFADPARYVGIPWLDRGRDRRGVDCWGLHRLVYAEDLGIALPCYAGDYAGPADRAAIQGLIDGGRSPWHPLAAAEVRPYDLVLLHDRPWHVGTYCGAGRMLHAPEGRSSVIEPITAGRFGRLVEGYYRYEALP